MDATMTVREAVSAIAALCRPGEAAVTLITVGGALSWCVASEPGAHDAARALADEDDPDVLAAAVIAADGALTGYKPQPVPGNRWSLDALCKAWLAKTRQDAGPETGAKPKLSDTGRAAAVHSPPVHAATAEALAPVHLAGPVQPRRPGHPALPLAPVPRTDAPALTGKEAAGA